MWRTRWAARREGEENRLRSTPQPDKRSDMLNTFFRSTARANIKLCTVLFTGVVIVCVRFNSTKYYDHSV